MSPIVIDASVMAPAVADGGSDGDACRAALRGHQLVAPDLLRVEVLAALRRHVAGGTLTRRQAEHAVDDLLALPITVYPTGPLLRRCWALRSNITTYDACYVALAEALGAPLLTADRRLATSAGSQCTVEVV